MRAGRAVLQAPGVLASPVNHRLADLLQPMGIRGDDDTYLHRVADSQWLRHVRTVIGAAAKIAHLLDREGCSVLVHCSDGCVAPR